MNINNATKTLAVENADLSRSSFHDVNLADSTFDDINFSRAKIQNVNLTAVRITDCNLTGMTIDGVPVADALQLHRSAHPLVPPAPINGDTHLRPFHPHDQPQVVALWSAVFNYTSPHNHPITTIEKKREWDPDLFTVAVRDSQVIGTALGGYDGHRGWIYSLAVDPASRRRGIASALVRHVEAALAARGCVKVNLQLLASNAETVAFYKKVGYAIEDRISMGKLL